MNRVSVVIALSLAGAAWAGEPTYVKKADRAATVLATLEASGVPNLAGRWHWIGPFDNDDQQGFDRAYPPEREIELSKSYPGRDGEKLRWHELPKFSPGRVVDLGRLYRPNTETCVYLVHTFIAEAAVRLPVSFGSDDTLSVWFNGERLLHVNEQRPAAPDQNRAVLNVRPGENRLLVKVCNVGGDFGVYICPDLPEEFPVRVKVPFLNDFPAVSVRDGPPESVHYRIETIPYPPEVVPEVGGLDLRSNGDLFVCTRRGDVWVVRNPGGDPAEVRWELFASGLHEPLGLSAESDRSVLVVQRAELTRLTDTDGDGRADRFETVCDRWGTSGDYHEFAFGPARDRDGNLFVTLNVGFGGGHQSKSPWRGWCVKVAPDGTLTPIATGLRSPNGVNFSPEGDLFYCDNQGEWVATNKLHEIRPGEFYGHQAGLRWVSRSPFAGRFGETMPSGMTYDAPGGPPHTPPAIWFPYGRMGQSASEPRWDTTAGRFGPFAGQMFVGDQTKSVIMRVALERVGGRHQGACFPFMSGFQCGVNRLKFAPDGTLYVGQTNRGWGSVGGQDYGLQRVRYSGKLPTEIHSMRATSAGFALTFTRPLDAATAEKSSAYALKSFTYNYWSNYGSPEVDTRAEKVTGVTVSADRKSVELEVPDRRPGRVYDLRLIGVRADDGTAVLHPEAYYTLNQLP